VRFGRKTDLFLLREEVFEFRVFIVERKCWIWGLRSWELKDNVGNDFIHTSPEERIAVSIILLLLLFLSVLTGSWRFETLDPGEWRFQHFVEVVGYHSQPIL
jgi:hypothetical protein